MKREKDSERRNETDRKSRRIAALVLFLVTALVLGLASLPSSGASIPQLNPPFTAAEALGTFQIDPGLRVECVAKEPLVESPVAIAWDASGKLYVAENRGYPTGSDDGAPTGRISLLADADGDGSMDQRTTFADELTFPNGLMPWDGGLIVTCAPDIILLKDTDGDGHADVRRVLLTGFDTRNSTQLRVAHPTFGPDGWIYLTSGLARPGEIRSPEHPNRSPIRIGADLRFDPLTLEIDALDGRGQFGQSFDDWGNRFHCMNRVHIQHTVISSRALKRNPNVAFSETVQNVPESMVDDLLKSKNLAARIYPISKNLTTADSHAGTFSAACSVHVYRGDGLPASYYGSVFACDPTGNLVHRDLLTPRGPTFSSRMANEGREFFASRDDWFRPVFVTTGPDGALYVCDMYRKTIEHPDYLPVEVRKHTDFASGRNMGRIWRISSVGTGDAGKTTADSRAQTLRQRTESNSREFSLDGAGSESLVALLGHSNGWRRETAMRLLVERRAIGVISLLLDALPSMQTPDFSKTRLENERLAEEISISTQAIRRIGQLNTLCALAGWSSEAMEPLELNSQIQREILKRLLSATTDASPGVRFTAWRWLERVPYSALEINEAILNYWPRDPNPAVRFRVALVLGNWNEKTALPGLAQIALQDGADKWTRAAVLTGIHRHELEFFDELIRSVNPQPAPQLMFDLGRCLGISDLTASNAQSLTRIEADWNDAVWESRIPFWAGLIEAGQSKGNPPSDFNLLEKAGFGKSAQAAIERNATRILHDNTRTLELRETAANLLWASGRPESTRELLTILQPGMTRALQSAVISLLAKSPAASAVESLISPTFWRALSPNNRDLLVTGMLSRVPSTLQLLAAIRNNNISATALSVAQRNRLLNHSDDRVREAAASLFEQTGGDRMRVYQEFKTVATLPASPENGKRLFTEQCGSCHRLEQEGFNVGPDLFGIRNQDKETTLLHILVPNFEVLTGFTAYDIETTDGRSLSGLIRSETETSVTLQMAQGVESTLRRAEILSLKASDLSLMPDGLEQTLSRQGLADLLAFLKGEQ